MSLVTDPSIPAGRTIAWAGIKLRARESWRLLRVEGDRKRGLFAAGKPEDGGIEIAWERAKIKEAAIEARCRKQFQQSLQKKGKKQKKKPELKPEPVADSQFDCMLQVTDEADGNPVRRAIAYSSKTKRMIQIALHLPFENETETGVILRSLTDQSPDEQMDWAFFDVSFKSPAGVQYRKSRLNIGDMWVELTNNPAEFEGPLVSVRHVYPAGLAMQRQPLSGWMQRAVYEDRKMRLPAIGKKAVKAGKFESMSCLLGDGIFTDMKLRLGMRFIYWREPKIKRHWMIHDEVNNRIIMFQVAGKADWIDETFNLLTQSTYWAQQEMAAANG